MDSISPLVLQEHLGRLAMKFRGTRIDADRREIARDYAEAVDRLIASGSWSEMPAFEDQLPDDWMPEAFFGYWMQRETVP